MLHRDSASVWLAVVASVVLGAAPLIVRAQDASPAGADAATVAAAGLTNPRGFVWGDDGTLYVALAGGGGLEQTAATPAASPPAGAGEVVEEMAEEDATPVLEGVAASLTADFSGAVVRIEGGCPVDVAAGLPSSGLLPLGWVVGVSDVAILGGELYALYDGAGEAGLHPDEPNGVYSVLADGTTELVADLSAWLRANPVADPAATGELSPDGEPYAMVPGDGVLWVAESNHQQVLTVAPDGTITRIADLSPLGDVVPTGIALAPEGGVYVGFLTAVPWPDGEAKVVRVAPDGAVSDVWTGLTAVTDIAIGPDGALYASELSTGNTEEDPFYRPDAGMVVRQTGPDSHEEVATGLNYPVHLGFGADGGLYVATPALGANDGEGMILRLDPTEVPISLADQPPSASAC